ncbi:MAG TPA: TIGR01777 family oxidoreductase [Bryobacteraceae bacterium]|nr:TIGR01777 family oxidoreductase [Bryobacteraceae bacterium]
MDYLITGATGFIGRNLVQRLLDSGNEVNYLARARSKTLDSRAAFHLWNPGEPPPLDSVPTADIVINLAGEPVAQRWNKAVKRRIGESRVNGTRSLVSAIGKLRHKPTVLISASATGYYGSRGAEPLIETSAPGNDFLADLCIHWELEALRAREFGLRVVLVRIAPVLGREGGLLGKMLPLFRAGLGGKLASGRQWMPWIHLDDLIRFLLFAAENQRAEGPFNASAPQPVTNAEFTRALGNALHRPTVFSVPKFALRLALGEAAGSMTASERVLPKAAQDAGFEFRYPEVGAALRNLLA